jgi:REP element-mobilizing transposase RayT
MSRKLRFLRPGSHLVEVTVRTVQGRFLFKPSPGFREIVIGLLARAQSLYPLKIHAVACLSNHLHLLLSPKDIFELAAFMRHFNTNLSKEAARLHDWSGPLLQRRYQAIPVSDEEEVQIARLRYILEQGCKENLVARPSDWPGAHCSEALVQGQPLAGIWFDRTAEYNARRKGASVDPEELATRYQLELAPLPCWEQLPSVTVQRYVAEMVQHIETETRVRHRLEGTRPLGIRSVLKQHPHSRPKSSKKSPAPLCHALSREVRQQLRQAYAAFVESYREAVQRLRRGDFSARFPAGSFLPPGPFPRPGPVLA